MKVLLVQSYLGGKEPLVYPLGLASLVPALQGHEVRMFDMNTSETPGEDLRMLCSTFKPEVAGISLRNIDSTNKRIVTFYYPFFKEAVKIVKSACDALLVAGGPGFSMFANEIMADEPLIDCGIHLEGESVFPELLRNLHAPERVKSVYYRKEGQVLFTGPAPGLDMTRIKAPDRSSLPAGRYLESRDAVGVETKRGCALKCVYCAYGFLNGSHYRLRNPADVADEIASLARNHGTSRFMFVDSVFNIPLDHAEEICDRLVRAGTKINWSAWFSEKTMTPAFLDLVLKAGCDHLIFSPDGFSDRVLETLGKNIAASDIRKAFNTLRSRAGFEITYNFFKNPPGQHLGNFIAMAVFCLEAKMRLGNRAHFEFSSLRIEPHTRLHGMAVEEGLLKEEDHLLEPRYYSNKNTLYIERLLDAALRLKGR